MRAWDLFLATSTCLVEPRRFNVLSQNRTAHFGIDASQLELCERRELFFTAVAETIWRVDWLTRRAQPKVSFPGQKYGLMVRNCEGQFGWLERSGLERNGAGRGTWAS